MHLHGAAVEKNAEQFQVFWLFKKAHNLECFRPMNSTASIPLSNHSHNQLRNEMVQQLKDILTALHEPEDTSESAEAPATGDGGEADAAEEAAAETSEGHLDGEANEDSGENENEGEMGDEPLAPGSTIDQMETLPFNGEVSEEWPPRPWIPKTSLRRWKKPKARFEQFLFLRV